jgi:signal transduction histidine kinase
LNQNWHGTLIRHLLLLVTASLLAGLISGRYGGCLAIGLGLYLAWTLKQLLRLHDWLRHHKPDEPPPDGYGLWGEVFDSIYHLQRRDQRVRGRLQAVIDRVQESTAALKDAVIMLDSEGNLEWWNRAAETLLGLKTPQDSGQPDFVANVSHELRTPLTVICGYLETLLDNVEEVNPRWVRALQQMQQQGGRMQTLLNDLLLLAKLEATDYPSDNQPVAVPALLQSIKNDAQALSGAKNQEIILDVESEWSLKGSEAELRSAFSNLIFNAVKYTPAEGKIRIRWWADGRGAHLSVQDSGIGIDPKHIPRLTERFYRVDSSRASNTGGTGLGLAIVKHVLLRHRGALEINSVPGKGSVFICNFAPIQMTKP